MMIIRHYVPDLPFSSVVEHVAVVDSKLFISCMKHDPRRAAELRPAETNLFGFLINENYVTPPNDGWEDVDQPSDQAGGNPNAAVVNSNPESQETLEDVLIQVEQQQHQGAACIVPDVAAEVVQNVLNENDDTTDDLLREIDNFESVNGARNYGDDDAPPSTSDTPAGFTRYQSRLVYEGTSSNGKRSYQ